MRFELQRQPLIRFLSLNAILGIVIIAVMLLGLTLMIAVAEGAGTAFILTVSGLALVTTLAAIAFAHWFNKQFASSLDYQMEDHILHIEEGVFTFKKSAIPLDRVTDFRLVQGIMMRWFGIWKIDVQTASSGEMSAEGTLWAIDSPKLVRDQLLAARKEAVQRATVGPAS